jgi:hypothetical protein
VLPPFANLRLALRKELRLPFVGSVPLDYGTVISLHHFVEKALQIGMAG